MAIYHNVRSEGEINKYQDETIDVYALMAETGLACKVMDKRIDTNRVQRPEMTNLCFPQSNFNLWGI